MTNNHDGVEVRGIRVLRGPNLYAYMPVLEVALAIGPYEDRPSNSLPGFVDRLITWLPSLCKHGCSLGRPGGFVERLRTGTYLPHIVEHVTLALQEQMGFDVSFGRARGTGEPGVYRVLIAYREEEPARAAFEVALRLVLAAMHDEPFELEDELERLCEVADDYRLGPSTAAIVEAARRRGIPVLRLTPTSSLVQLGHGVHQKRIRAAETSLTSAIAVDIVQDKPLTNRLLQAVGLPVPEGQPVHSADEAWQVAQDIGLPVVVKPEAGNQGRGVSTRLTSEAEVRAAYALARQVDRGAVLVEQHVHGRDHRLLVVGGKLVAAARRDPAQVTGDGRRSVRELVEELNRDPRRRPGHTSVLTRVRLDASTDLVLGQQSLSLDAVPAAGQVVRLCGNGNLSTGGTATDVTDLVCPSNVRVAELAAQILALDVAGIDFVCEDISHPVREQGGAIVEVNAAPGLRMHLAPAEGQPRDVAVPIVEMLYPPRAPARIPIVAVTGTNGKTTVTRLVAHMFETARKVVGMTTTEGTYIAGERIIRGDCSGPRSARTVLLHPRVEAAVLETARGGILREGLAFDWCTVGVVTNVSADHLGLRGIHSVEELARVKQVVIENVHRDGAAVLNADDPLVAEMAAVCSGRVVYFGLDPRSSVMAAHLAAGGDSVFVEDGAVVLARDGLRTVLMELERVPCTAGGRIRFQVQNVLAAAAAGWAAGLNPALLARALATFHADVATVPARFNVSDVQGVQLVLDYGHNVAAMRALSEAVVALGPRRTVMLLGLPGDRRDEDLRATIEASLACVDEYVLYDQTDRRGRAPGAVPELLQTALPSDRPSVRAPTQEAGIREAWARVGPGDRLIVIADEVDEALAVIQELATATLHDALCLWPISRETAPVAAA